MKLPHGGQARHDPSQFRMLVDLRLHEDGIFLRIQPQRYVLSEKTVRALAKQGRILLDGQGVEIGQEIEAIILLLERLPVVNRPDIVSQREVTCDGASA
jgi:hypothetical protein